MGVFGSSLTKRTRSGCGWLEAMPSSTTAAAAATPIADERKMYAAARKGSILDNVMVVLSSR